MTCRTPTGRCSVTTRGRDGERANHPSQPASARPGAADPRHPIADRLVRWLQEPEIIADPEQTEDGRVWTRAQDLIPGAVVRDGQPLTAAWGELTWTALPVWDEQDIDTLWLCPIGAPEPPPEARTVHDLSSAVERILSQPDRANVESVVQDLLGDFGASIEIIVQTQRRHRQWARQLLEDLDKLRPAALRALDRERSGQHLRALARLPPSAVGEARP